MKSMGPEASLNVASSSSSLTLILQFSNICTRGVRASICAQPGSQEGRTCCRERELAARPLPMRKPPRAADRKSVV